MKNNNNFLQYRHLLISAEEDARARLLQERPGINIQAHSDAIDSLIEALEREQSITTSMRATEVLRNVRAALARMQEGTYGECVHCGEAIAPKRLAAIPWTPNCLNCQKQIDEQHLDPDGQPAV